MLTKPVNPTALASLREVLSSNEYLRERSHPKLNDVSFLAFTDLLQLVRDFAGRTCGSVFDYGCGGSPYRELFTTCTVYVGADLAPGPRVQRILKPDGMTDEPTAHHDAVLSSQVLEHVPDPGAYLRECCRILKPGGELLLTTHGMFLEHGSPDDYHRWTSQGLERLVSASGLEVFESFKLTADIRGVTQQAHYFVEQLRCSDRPGWHHLFAVLRRVYRWFGVPLLNVLGRAFSERGVLPAEHPAAVYVGVSVCARKPV